MRGSRLNSGCRKLRLQLGSWNETRTQCSGGWQTRLALSWVCSTPCRTRRQICTSSTQPMPGDTSLSSVPYGYQKAQFLHCTRDITCHHLQRHTAAKQLLSTSRQTSLAEKHGTSGSSSLFCSAAKSAHLLACLVANLACTIFLHEPIVTNRLAKSVLARCNLSYMCNIHCLLHSRYR